MPSDIAGQAAEPPAVGRSDLPGEKMMFVIYLFFVAVFYFIPFAWSWVFFHPNNGDRRQIRLRSTAVCLSIMVISIAGICLLGFFPTWLSVVHLGVLLAMPLFGVVVVRTAVSRIQGV